MKKKPLPLIVLFTAFAAMMAIDLFALRVSTIVLMLAAAVVGLIVYLARRKSRKEGSE